jgi:hypothetical protein
LYVAQKAAERTRAQQCRDDTDRNANSDHARTLADDHSTDGACFRTQRHPHADLTRAQRDDIQQHPIQATRPRISASVDTMSSVNIVNESCIIALSARPAMV